MKYWSLAATALAWTLVAIVAIPAEEIVSSGTPQIVIQAKRGKAWQVEYRLQQPTTLLVFPRSPDNSRSETWIATDEFEIVSLESSEIARRKDRAAFANVSFAVEPKYIPKEKDYAPFSPFGDGGMLFHSGRFFACAEACADKPEWSMRLLVSAPDRIILNGQQLNGSASWMDQDDGRNIYVGTGEPVETQDFIAVIDQALPGQIRNQLLDQLPRFMRVFSSRLGELPARPMLFASYDLSHSPGWGRQGGTLPRQIFTHFYGSRWPEQMKKPEFANDLAWHFAHEAAHLYQRQIFLGGADAWIHEGAAEAFAALALRSQDLERANFVDSKIEAAMERCALSTKMHSVLESIKEDGFDAAYTCGLVLSLSIHSAVRHISPGSDGLYAVWRDFASRSAEQRVSESDYLASIAKTGNDELAAAVRRAVRAKAPDLRELGF